MIEITTLCGDPVHEKYAMKMLAAYSGPAFEVSQDPGCFYQIRPEVMNGVTRLIWEFGAFGNNILAHGYFTGCKIEYRLQHHGSRGGYSETIYADSSILYPTFEKAIEAINQIKASENEAIQRVIERWEKDYDGSDAHLFRVKMQAGCLSEVGITTCFVIE